MKNGVIEKLVGELKLQSMIFKASKNKAKSKRCNALSVLSFLWPLENFENIISELKMDIVRSFLNSFIEISIKTII